MIMAKWDIPQTKKPDIKLETYQDLLTDGNCVVVYQGAIFMENKFLGDLIAYIDSSGVFSIADRVHFNDRYVQDDA